MEIFEYDNLLIEIGDWLASNQIKLGHFSHVQASKEHWFQFEIASLILGKWERVLKVPFADYNIYIERQSPLKKKDYIDLVIAPESDDKEKNYPPNWDKSGIIEFKTFGYHLKPKSPQRVNMLNSVKNDFEKRKDIPCRDMIAITLCNHNVDEDEWTSHQKMIQKIELDLKGIIEDMNQGGYQLPRNKKSMPYTKSSFKEILFGFYSCGVWIKKRTTT
jgi:hypothetical protein